MADLEPPDPGLVTPIAQIHPSNRDNGTHISGLVTLIWPYSSSRKEFSLLLVESDFRLRRNKGQVRIVFDGASAKAAARADINSGDRLSLWLKGARYEKAETTIATPGRSVEYDLHFGQVLRFRVERRDQEALSVTVDHPPSTPSSRRSSPGLSGIVPNTSDHKSHAGDNDGRLGWESPAFLKRKRISSLPYFDSSYDPFSNDSDTDPQPLLKKSRFGRRSGEWIFAERTPSPEAASEGDPFLLPFAGTTGIELAKSPVTTANSAYITAPPSEEEVSVQNEQHRAHKVSPEVLENARPTSVALGPQASCEFEDVQPEHQAHGLATDSGESREQIMEEMLEDRTTDFDSKTTHDFENVLPIMKSSNEPRVARSGSSEPTTASSKGDGRLALVGERNFEEDDRRISSEADAVRSVSQSSAREDERSEGQSQASSTVPADYGLSKSDEPLSQSFASTQHQLVSFDYVLDGTTPPNLQTHQHSMSSFAPEVQQGTNADPEALKIDDTGGESSTTDQLSASDDVRTETFAPEFLSSAIHVVLNEKSDPSDSLPQKPHHDPTEPLASGQGDDEVTGSRTTPTNDGLKVPTLIQEPKFQDEATHSPLKTNETKAPSVINRTDDPKAKTPVSSESLADTSGHEPKSTDIPSEADLNQLISEAGREKIPQSHGKKEYEDSGENGGEGEKAEDGEQKAKMVNAVGSKTQDSYEGSAEMTTTEFSCQPARLAAKDEIQDTPAFTRGNSHEAGTDGISKDGEANEDNGHVFDENPEFLHELAVPGPHSADSTKAEPSAELPPQEVQPLPWSANAEAIDLEDHSEDEQVKTGGLLDTNIHLADMQKEAMTSDADKPLPSESQDVTTTVIRARNDEETVRETPMQSERTFGSISPRQNRDEMAIEIGDQARSLAVDQTNEAQNEDDVGDEHEMLRQILPTSARQTNTDDPVKPYPDGVSSPSLRLANDHHVSEDWEQYLPGGSRPEPSADISSSPPPFIPEDDFLDVTHDSYLYEDYLAVHEESPPPSREPSRDEIIGVERKQAKSPILPWFIPQRNDERQIETESLFLQYPTGAISTLTNPEAGVLTQSDHPADTPDIPIDPSLFTGAKVETQIITPEPTQQPANIVTEASRLSLRSITPPPHHLPTPSLTQNTSIEPLPMPKTPATVRTSNVIEKLKSRSKEKKKENRTSNIAPVVSPWFEPKRSSQIASSHGSSPASLRGSRQASQVVADVEISSSSQMIPDDDDEGPGDLAEELKGADKDEDLSTHEQLVSKIKQSPPDVVGEEVFETQIPRPSTSLPGLRTPLSYFAPLSSLPSHFSTSISILAILVSSTKPERAKKGPRDYTMTLRLSDPSLHQQQSSQAPPPSTPYLKASQTSLTSVTAMLFRPHHSALPTIRQPGDAILLRNFKATSLKGKIGLTSTESSAWAVFQSDKGWEPSVQGPPVEFGPEERAYASGLGRWWGSIKERGDEKVKGKGKGKDEDKGAPLSSSPLAPAPEDSMLRHELRDGKEYVDDESVIEEAKSERRDRRRSRHVLRDGKSYRDD